MKMEGNSQSKRSRLEYPLTPEYIKKARKKEIIIEIQKIISTITQPVEENQMPSLEIIDRCWSNTTFDEYLKLKSSDQLTKVHIRYAHKPSQNKFEILINVLKLMYKHLKNDTTCTKRDIFYQDKVKYNNQQSKVDGAINDICCLLNASPWELNVLPTSKGLIVGPLQYVTADLEVVFCKKQGGVQVPQDVQGISTISSTAEAIIIIEKDATFQKILDDGGLTMPWIMITGKGVPDINTRMMVKKLWETLKIPVYAMVDGDPYGIEIMCTYRFGSLQLVHLSHILATPAVKWLGILPTDIDRFLVPSIPLTEQDVSKVKSLQARSYVKAHPAIQEQLQEMLDKNHKTGIETFAKIAPRYLTNVFIPNLIRSNSGI